MKKKYSKSEMGLYIRLEEEREKYRLSETDIKYFLYFYASVFIILLVSVIFLFNFFMIWNFYFFLLLILPFFYLEIKSYFITRKRKQKYEKIIESEIALLKYNELFISFAHDEANKMLLEAFEIVKPFKLDTKFALNKLHEIKRFAVVNNFDGVFNIKIQDNGYADGILVRKKQK